MPADDFADGVDGKGQKWKDRVDTDDAENNFEGGFDSEAADDYESEASGSSDDYEEGLADYFGVSEDQVNVGGAYAQGVGEAGDDWQSGGSGSGSRWRDGVQRTSASEWEENAADAASEWFQNAKEGIQD